MKRIVSIRFSEDNQQAARQVIEAILRKSSEDVRDAMGWLAETKRAMNLILEIGLLNNDPTDGNGFDALRDLHVAINELADAMVEGKTGMDVLKPIGRAMVRLFEISCVAVDPE